MHMACDNNHILHLANYVHDAQSGHVSIMQISAHIPTAVHVITLILALEQLLKLLAQVNALSLNSLSLTST